MIFEMNFTSLKIACGAAECKISILATMSDVYSKFTPTRAITIIYFEVS